MHTILAHAITILKGLPPTADPTALLRDLHARLDDLVGGNRTLELVALRLATFHDHWPDPAPGTDEDDGEGEVDYRLSSVDYRTDLATMIVDLERLRDALAHPDTMWQPKGPPINKPRFRR